MSNKLQAANHVFASSDFSVGDFVRHRDWAVPAAGKQQPRLSRKVMRIIEVLELYGKTVFVCGGGRQFEAFEIVPA